MKSVSILSLTLCALCALPACSDSQRCASESLDSAPSSTVVCEDAAGSVGPAGPPHTISVTGYGVAVSAPDVVHIHFGVQSRDASAAKALADNRAKVTAVRAALSALGVVEADVQVASYSLSPQVEMDPATGTYGLPTSFVADNSISVALRDPARTDEAIAGVFEAGATTIHSVGFMLGDPQRLNVEARESAMADARVRAEQLARAAGVALGPPLSMQEVGGSLLMFPDAYGMGPSTTAPTPGKMQQTANVNVTYRIP